MPTPVSTQLKKVYLLFFTAMLFGCSDSEPFISKTGSQDANNLFTVITTTTQVTDLVRQISGEDCKIIPLMGTGVDPHLYKPTARDMSSLSTADLIVYHGLKLEGKLAHVLEKAERSKVMTYSVCSVIPDSLLLAAADYNETLPDPHVWFSPSIWTLCMHGVAERMGNLIPEKRELFSQRAEAIEQRYSSIKSWASQQLEKIPKTKRKLITSHDAFRYLGRSFGIEVIALQGVSTAIEAGLGDRSNLVDYLRQNQVSALFVESSVNPAALKEIAKETQIKVGSPLFSDAFGSKERQISGPNGEKYALSTWAGMMIHNINAMVEGLQ